jgi:RHS repeat-associated protein
VTYTYDALNRRIGEQIDADGAGSGTPVQTWTVFDGQNPYDDFNGSGTLKDRYLYGPAVDALLARTDTSGVTDWYLADRLGSVRDIVDLSGNVVYHTGYDSFGNKVSSSGSGGDRFGFTGREHDAALNLYYNRARFYDPATGRFLSKDPSGFSAGDANLYRYVNNSPTNGTDPSGLDWLDSASNFFAGVGDVLTGSATDALRNYAGINDGIDHNSWEYSTGQISGVALGTGITTGAAVGTVNSGVVALTNIAKMLGQQMPMQGVGLVGATGCVYVSGGVVVSTQAVAVGLITTGFAIGSLNTIVLHMEEYGKRIPAPEKQVGYIRDKIYKELGKDTAREFHDLKDRALGDRTIIEAIQDAMQLYEDAGQLIPKWLKRIKL